MMTLVGWRFRQSSIALLRKRRGWLALTVNVALALGASGVPAQHVGACERDVADLERVASEIVLGSSTAREVALLLHAAKSACTENRSGDAQVRLGEAWTEILQDSSLLAPTVPELASSPCGDGLGALEQQASATEAGALTRKAAGDLVEQARTLCRGGQELDAEAKLAMAWTMIVPARNADALSD